MAPLSLYDMTIPIFIHNLHSLDKLLTKAELHAKEHNILLSTFIEGKLAPDMADFVFQVGAAGEFARFVLTRVAGLEVEWLPHDETTFEQLHARIAFRIGTFESVKREDLEGKEDVVVMHRGMKWTALEWCGLYCVPNFFFHVVTAYGILRHCGVQIGKADFLGLPEDFFTRPLERPLE